MHAPFFFHQRRRGGGEEEVLLRCRLFVGNYSLELSHQVGMLTNNVMCATE